MDKLTLNKVPAEKWIHNLIVFLAPLAVLYLTTTVGVISADPKGFQLQDLIPNTFAQGGLILWILNAALDYFRKLKSQ